MDCVRIVERKERMIDGKCARDVVTFQEVSIREEMGYKKIKGCYATKEYSEKSVICKQCLLKKRCGKPKWK